jgi:hypothetical protein
MGVGENPTSEPSAFQNMATESAIYGGPLNAFATNAGKAAVQSIVHGIPESVAKGARAVGWANSRASQALGETFGISPEHMANLKTQEALGNQFLGDALSAHAKAREYENKLIPANSLIGKAGEVTGEIAGGVAKATAMGPAAAAGFVSEAFLTTFDDEIQRDPSNPLRALGVSMGKAGLTAGLMGMPGKEAFGSLGKLVAYKTTRGVALGASMGLGDAIVDQFVGGQTLTAKDYWDRVKHSVVQMLGYEIAGAIPASKLIQPARRVTREYASIDEARANIGFKLALAQSDYIDFMSEYGLKESNLNGDTLVAQHAQHLKTTGDDLFKQMQAVSYAEKAKMKFTGQPVPRKETSNAVQESSAGTVGTYPGREEGTGGEGREGVGPGEQGEEPARTQEAQEKEPISIAQPAPILERQPGESTYQWIRREADRVTNNPEEAINKYSQIESTEGGSVIDADRVGKVFGGIQEDPIMGWLAPPDTEASKIATILENRAISEPTPDDRPSTIVVMGGPQASGKSEIAGTIRGENRASYVFDGLNLDPDEVLNTMSRIRNSGKTPIYVMALSPLDTIVDRNAERFVRDGRPVGPMDQVQSLFKAKDMLKTLVDEGLDSSTHVVFSENGKHEKWGTPAQGIEWIDREIGGRTEKELAQRALETHIESVERLNREKPLSEEQFDALRTAAANTSEYGADLYGDYERQLSKISEQREVSSGADEKGGTLKEQAKVVAESPKTKAVLPEIASAKPGVPAKTPEPVPSEAEDKVRKLFPGDENKALRNAIYNSGVHRQTDSDIAIKEMAKQLSKPAQAEVGNAIKMSVDKIGAAFKPIKGALAPSTESPSAQRVADVYSWGKSLGAQKLSIVKSAVMPALRILDRSPKSLQDLVVDAVENKELRSSIKDPRLSEFAISMKDLQDSLWQAIKDRGGEMGYEEDYLHHAFKNSKSAKEILRKARLEGNLGYMKDRTGPDTYRLAREIPGLEPRETNAARIILEDAANKIKYIYTHDILSKAREEGLLLEGIKTKDKDGKTVEHAPPGMVPVSRDISVAMARTKVDKCITYYAYPEVVKIINNHLSPGFEGNPVYGLARFINNSMNQVELGLSAFHVVVISNEIAATMIGTGIKNGLAGKTVEGLKQVTTGLTPVLAQVKVYREGSKLIEALESGKELPEELGGKGFQDYFNKGGARTQMDAEYVNNNLDRLRQAWGQMTDKEQTLWVRTKGGVKVAVRIPFATIETAMKPIMEYYVPRAKVAMFKRMYDVVKDSIPSDATDAEISRRARRDWDQIENAFGQLTHDNLHWNKMFKQSMMLGIRAVGWKLGSKRAIYGAAIDLSRAIPMGVKEISRALHISTASEAQLAKELAAARVRGDFEPGAAITNRIAWAIGQAMVMTLVATVAMGGRAIYKKRKGEELSLADVPHGMDAIYPRTGEKTSMGEEKRIAMASYMREGVDDFLSWKDLILHGSTKGFQDQIKSARSPLAGWGMELLPEHLGGQKDWRGAKIDNQLANFGSKFIPIGGSKFIQERNKGNTWSGAAQEAGLQMAGFLRPKASHLQTDAQRRIYELWGDKYKIQQTSSEVDENMRAKGLAEQKASGQNVDKELEELSPSARKRANLNPKSQAMVYMAKRFNYDDLKDVIKNYANPEEQKLLYPLLDSAFRRSLIRIPVSKRESAVQGYREFVQKIRQESK